MDIITTATVSCSSFISFWRCRSECRSSPDLPFLQLSPALQTLVFCGHKSLRTAAWLFVSVCISNTFQVAQWSRIHLQCRKAEDTGLIPRSGRSPEEGNGYPLQYSYLENSMDKGSWQAIVHGFAESDTTQHA